jgi:hypothetical protein
MCLTDILEAYIFRDSRIIGEYDLFFFAPVDEYEDVTSPQRNDVSLQDKEIRPQVGAPPKVEGRIPRQRKVEHLV